ncbi:uncharacterized protein LOC129753488 [Uranotaenia lowii]|uniref:uncharacterized protein LOC129753488 n=1 Tax=Uranotaenia lowii TaxID=190385 RepID=UPI002478BC9B|nr:uncharacterized protein LOC129753488 [Uranotaenia lowii]
MKLYLVGVLLAAIGIQATFALKCMQGVEVMKNGEQVKDSDKNKTPEITECNAASALASTGFLIAIKPSTISFPSGNYNCYHLKYTEKDSDSSTIIKGCIYKSIQVCDGKFTTDKVSEQFCSQCEADGCNAAGRFGIDLKLLGLTFAALVAYLLK